MQINWKLKSFLFFIIGAFRLHRFMFLLQKYLLKSSAISRPKSKNEWVNRLRFAEKHRIMLNRYAPINASILEFGVGKNLMQNLYLSTSVGQQLVIDRMPMADVDLIEKSRQYINCFNKRELPHLVTSIDDLRKYNINYLAPMNICGLDKVGVLDACVSTNVLEHMSRSELRDCFNTCWHMLKVGGILCSQIDYADHYSYTDTKITKLNFLKFSEKEWNNHNHYLHFQNRIRHHEYTDLLEDCGYTIEYELPVFEEEMSLNVDETLPDPNWPVTWRATSGYIVAKKT